MKRNNGEASTSGSKGSSAIFPTEDEMIVAQILVDLRLIFMPHLSFVEYLADSNWKRRKRRSCLDQIPPLRAAVLSSGNEIKAAVAVEKNGGGHRTTTSPDSPFTFAPSDESPEKLKHSSKENSRKRHYLDSIEQLTQQKGFLRREIKNVKKYYTKLKAYNSELKTIKHEISRGMMNVGIGSTHHQPLIADATAQGIQYPITAQSQPSNNGPGSVNRVGPIGFDLNAPAEETLGFVVDELQPLDVNRVISDRRARYAEARRMRRGIMKTKSIKNGV
ncbi:hypothetical protein ACS0TY_035732 [Phlomoides rotata]